MTPAVIWEEHPGCRWKKWMPRGRKSWVRCGWEEAGRLRGSMEAGRREVRLGGGR